MKNDKKFYLRKNVVYGKINGVTFHSVGLSLMEVYVSQGKYKKHQFTRQAWQAIQGEQLAEIKTFGPWQIAYACTSALCSDGKRRYARITGQPDTWFSIPAQVKVKGKTISGYITGRSRDDDQRDYEFRQYTYRKNHELLPPWTE